MLSCSVSSPLLCCVSSVSALLVASDGSSSSPASLCLGPFHFPAAPLTLLTQEELLTPSTCPCCTSTCEREPLDLDLDLA